MNHSTIRFVAPLLFLIVGLSTTELRGQEGSSSDSTTHWKKEGVAGLNFTQIALSNWNGGGQNTIAVIGLFNSTAEYHRSPLAWINTIELGYGMAKLGDNPLRKSDDKIILTSKFGVAALPEVQEEQGDPAKQMKIKHTNDQGSVLSYTALIDFRTQFTAGRNFKIVDSITGESPVISNLMAPGYLTAALGLEYRPVQPLSLLYSPVAGRFTFVLDDVLSQAGSFGVDPGSKVKADLGVFFNAQYRQELMTNVTLQSRLNLFASYSKLDAVATTWETQLLMKVNEFINVSISADVIYDEEIEIARDNGTVGPATQFRNTLAVGITYPF